MREFDVDADPRVQRIVSILDAMKSVMVTIASTTDPYLPSLLRVLAYNEPGDDFATKDDTVYAVLESSLILGEGWAPPLQWTVRNYRRANGSWLSAIWLLPQGWEKLEGICEHTSRMRALHGSVLAAIIRLLELGLVHRKADILAEANRREELEAQAEFAERLRVQEEHVRLVAARRALRASQDAEWDAARPTRMPTHQESRV